MKVEIVEGYVHWDGKFLIDYVFSALRMSEELEWVRNDCYWMVLD